MVSFPCPECHYVTGHTACCTNNRALDFVRHPMLSDFIATALQDLQFSEADEACTDERDARDSGTIYTLERATYRKLKALHDRFEVECDDDITAALELIAGDEGLEYARRTSAGFTFERLGSTLWLAVTGSGVTFTDDGNAPCLERLAEWARANHIEGLYFGDDSEVYFSG